MPRTSSKHPLGTIIAPVDYDHQNFLGDKLSGIAMEKAGILKRGAKAVFARQRDEGRAVLVREAARLGITPLIAGEDFDGRAEEGRLVYQDEQGLLDLPPPALAGPHQFDNAALAIAATRHFGLPVTDAQIAEGLRSGAMAGPPAAGTRHPARPAARRLRAVARWRPQRPRRRCARRWLCRR